MPQHDADQIAADEAAMNQGRCPESGINLNPETALGHIEKLWPTGHPARDNPDAKRRIKLITDWSTKALAAKAKKPAQSD